MEEQNVSIIVPGRCNARCIFCFWKEEAVCGGYLAKLDSFLNGLPDGVHPLSLTGGEPTMSPLFGDVLEIVKTHKGKFKRVVLTTNGSFLANLAGDIEGVVDHVNISRHSYDDEENWRIFGTDLVPKTEQLETICFELNVSGIDVTLSMVAKKEVSVVGYVAFAKKVGASCVVIRKPHGTLAPSELEQGYDGIKPVWEYSCGVCRTKKMLIGGMPVLWKASVSEPSKQLGESYEFIFHPTGKVTTTWDTEEQEVATGKEVLKDAIREILQEMGIVRSPDEDFVCDLYTNSVASSCSGHGGGGGC